VPANKRDNILVYQPKSDEERHAVAGTCVLELGIKFPALVDGINNEVETAYTAHPDRLYVVGADGNLAYKGGPGPRGFNSKELGEFLRRTLPPSARPTETAETGQQVQAPPDGGEVNEAD